MPHFHFAAARRFAARSSPRSRRRFRYLLILLMGIVLREVSACHARRHFDATAASRDATPRYRHANKFNKISAGATTTRLRRDFIDDFDLRPKHAYAAYSIRAHDGFHFTTDKLNFLYSSLHEETAARD